MVNAVWNPELEGDLIPITVVNCSNLELLELPESLPEHTTTLDASVNRVSFFVFLIQEHYSLLIMSLNDNL